MTDTDWQELVCIAVVSVCAVSISGYSGALSLPSSSFVAKCLRR